MRGFIAFIVGVIFALGLGYSGMTQPHIVRGFLNIGEHWNWSLMGVMIGAIGVHAITYQLIRKRSSPLLVPDFQVPTKKEIDMRLIIGAMLFGVGWGWAGICPGPGIVALASGETSIIIFILSMLVGMKIFQWSEKRKV